MASRYAAGNESASFTRRGFLQFGVAGASSLAFSNWPSQVSAETNHSTKTPAEKVLDRLKGPMASITIPYAKDFSIDHGALRGWVDFMCDRKAPILFMTYGDSELDNLSGQEIVEVMQTVAGQAKRRALVIGGTTHGWTGQTVDLVNRLEDAGVDAVNVHVYSKREEDIYRGLSQVAEKTRLPLLAYESKFSVDLVKRIAEIPRMIGIKCHAELYNYYNFIRATKDRNFGVLSAGHMKHFLFGYLIGSPAYLCPLTPFAPQVGLAFYRTLAAGDIDGARQIIFDYEEPLFKITIPLGYPQAFKSALYLRGQYKTNLVRPPMKSNVAAEITQLREYLVDKGLLSS